MEEACYDRRMDGQGWTVFDVQTGLPVVVDGVPLVGLDFEDADEMVLFLNKLYADKSSGPGS